MKRTFVARAAARSPLDERRITKVLLVVTALIAAYVATYRLAIIVELVAWAFSLAAASFFLSDGNDVRFWLLLALGPIMHGIAVRTPTPPTLAG